MRPRPLAQLRLDWLSHLSALYWLGVLYRRPAALVHGMQELHRQSRLAVWLGLVAHSIPWMIGIFILGRLAIHGLFGLPADEGYPTEYDFGMPLEYPVGVGLVLAITLGMLRGPVFGVALGSVYGFFGGIVTMFLAGIPQGIELGTIGEISFAVLFGVVGGVTWGVAYGLPRGTGGGLVFNILTGIIIGIVFRSEFGVGVGIAYGVASGIALLRAYYLPFHVLFVWPKPLPQYYRYHPVAWDELCLAPLPGLGGLLVSYADHEPEAADSEIERLIDHYPSQRQQALYARTVIVARNAARVTHLAKLNEILGLLPEGTKGFLAETRRVRELVQEIAIKQARLDTVDRAVFREPYASDLTSTIEAFRHKAAGFHEPLKSEFRAAAASWMQIARTQLESAQSLVTREPTKQVFRAGDPIDSDREAFVPRNEVFGEVEQQLMLASGCPGLVLYGRRRMGKSTVLRNLRSFLPPTVLPVIVSMQEARAFTSTTHLVQRLATAATDNSAAEASSLPDLQRLLDATNARLETEDRRIVIGLDEYENLDRKIRDGEIVEDVLAVIRESIQSHRRIIWLFAGSHELTELEGAPWTSYLVSARTIQVLPFMPAETRLLLTEPLQKSKLWAPDDPSRPHFASDLWGQGGIERIHDEAGGWPHLVQLVAETVVDLLNIDGAVRADSILLNRAFDKAIVKGDLVLHELIRGESRLPGEWDYLALFRQQDELPLPTNDAIRQSLRRRLLVTEYEGRMRLRVPLMARWLRHRA